MAILKITLGSSRATYLTGDLCFDRITGEQETLLQWLETHLGLSEFDVHRPARVTQYASALEKVSDACFAESLAASEDHDFLAMRI